MKISKNKKMRVALSGAYATGKTTVLSLFRELGFVTLAADNIVHDLYKDPKIIEQVRALYPNCVIHGINRDILGAAILQDKELLTALEKLLWPHVKARREEFFQKHQNKCIIYEFPLLHELGEEKEFDLIINLVCNREIRKERAKARWPKKPSLFDFFEERQISDLIRQQKSDIIIDTTAPIENIKQQILGMIE